jgi:hypothetical protein
MSVPEPSPAQEGGREHYRRASFKPAEEPSVSIEVVLVGGQEGAELRAIQAQAIKEVLTWLRDERQRPGGTWP